MSAPVAVEAIGSTLEELVPKNQVTQTVNPLDADYFARLYRGEAPMPAAPIKDAEIVYLMQQLKIQQASLTNVALSKEAGFMTGGINKLLSMN